MEMVALQAGLNGINASQSITVIRSQANERDEADSHRQEPDQKLAESECCNRYKCLLCRFRLLDAVEFCA